MSSNTLCVYSAGSVNEADVVVAWLADHGIAAIVPNQHITHTLGLPNVIPDRIEVCVSDEQQLTEARALLIEHELTLAQHLAAVRASGTVSVTCESCGESVEAQARDAGHVIDCPHCHEYIDVPDPTQSAG